MLSVPGSITRPGVAEELVRTAGERFGPAQLIVNTVAVNTSFGSLLDVRHDAFAAALVRNTWPTIALAQAAVAGGMGEGGAIVAVSTIGGHSIQPEVAPYCASKAALDVLVRNLAYELGPSGIRVNAVAPGLVRTDMSRALWEGEQEQQEAGLLPLRTARAPAGHRVDDLLPAVGRRRLDHGASPGRRRRRLLAGQGPARRVAATCSAVIPYDRFAPRGKCDEAA